MLSVLAAGCATVDRSTASGSEFPSVAQAASSQSAPQSVPLREQPKAGAPANNPDGAAGPRVFPGTDQLVKPGLTPRPDPVLAQGDRVSLNFENVTVSSLAAALLGDLLKVSYTIDAGGETMVSLRTRKPLPRKQVLDVLDTVLLPHDLAIVRDTAGVYHVTKRSATLGSRPLTSASRIKDLVGAGTVIVPLDHVGAGEMAKILGPLAPREAIVYVDTLRNLLVLQGSKIQLEGWLEMVDAFDVDYLSGMSLGVFPLEYTNVSVVYDTLQTMLAPEQAAGAFGAGSSAQGAGQSGAGAGRPATAAQGAAQAGGGGPLNGLVRLFPVERLNALVVVTPRSQVLAQVETWIRRLDQPTDSLEAGLFVYPVQNGSAVRMAELLNGLFGSSSGGSRAGVAGGSAPSQFGQAGSAGAFGNNSANRSGTNGLSSLGSGSSSGLSGLGSSSGASGSGVGGASAFGASIGGVGGSGSSAALTSVSDLEGNVRVVADETRNALLIRAPRTEYRRIERALRELDKAPTQVLIEATIVEITLTGDLTYGLEWAFNNGLGGGQTGSGLLSIAGSADLNPAQKGFTYSIANNAGAVRATLNALAKRSQIRVLSNPSLLVLDNHNATILVGNQVPVRTGNSTVSNGVVIDSFSYKDTGVMLSVSPSVNSGGLITLGIAQAVTDTVDAAAGSDAQPRFLTRQIHSRVAVRSGETIVLGGLIREKDDNGRNGVPLLSDVPILGALFSTTAESRERTELMVLLTPRALEDDDQVRAASVEMRQRIRSLSLQGTGGSGSGAGLGSTLLSPPGR